MTSETDRSLSIQDTLPPGFLSEIEAVISDRILRYAMNANLGTSDEDLAIATGIQFRAFLDGYEGPQQFAHGNIKRLIGKAIDAGLDFRKDLIHRGNETVHRYETPVAIHPTTLSLREAYLIDNPTISGVKNELYDPIRNVSLDKTREFLTLVSEREQALPFVARRIFTKILDLPEDHPVIQQNGRLLEDPSNCARIVNGYIMAHFLDIYFADKKNDPLFISNESIQDFIEIIPDIERESDVPEVVIQKIIRQLGFSEQESTPEARILESSLQNIIWIAKNWDTPARKNLDPSTPMYWEKMREFFRFLPLSPINQGYRFGFYPEQLQIDEEEGMGHLWKNGARFGEYIIPSAQDLSFGEYARKVQLRNQVLNPGESDRVYSRIKQAQQAWRQYSTSVRLPPKIAALQQELLEVLPSVPADLLQDKERKSAFTLIYLVKRIHKMEKIINMHKGLEGILGEQDREKRRKKIQRYYYADRMRTYKAEAKAVDQSIFTVLGGLQQPLLMDFSALMIEGNFTGFDPDQRENFMKSYETHQFMLGRMIRKKIIPEEYAALVRQYPVQFRRFVDQLSDSERNESFFQLSNNTMISDLSESYVLRQALQAHLSKRVKQFAYFLHLKERQFQLQQEATALAEYHSRIGSPVIDVPLSNFVPGTEAQELAIRLLPPLTDQEIKSSIATTSDIKRFLWMYSKNCNFILPDVVNTESIEAITASLTHNSYRGRKKAFLRGLAHMVNNPFVPTKEAAGLWASTLVDATRIRLKLARALYDHDRISPQIERIEVESKDYARYMEYRDVVTKVRKIQNTIKRLQTQYDTADATLLERMRRLNFVLDADSPFYQDKSK